MTNGGLALTFCQPVDIVDAQILHRGIKSNIAAMHLDTDQSTQETFSNGPDENFLVGRAASLDNPPLMNDDSPDGTKGREYLFGLRQEFIGPAHQLSLVPSAIRKRYVVHQVLVKSALYSALNEVMRLMRGRCPLMMKPLAHGEMTTVAVKPTCENEISPLPRFQKAVVATSSLSNCDGRPKDSVRSSKSRPATFIE